MTRRMLKEEDSGKPSDADSDDAEILSAGGAEGG
jgi:hypothetical protein